MADASDALNLSVSEEQLRLNTDGRTGPVANRGPPPPPEYADLRQSESVLMDFPAEARGIDTALNFKFLHVHKFAKNRIHAYTDPCP